MTREFFVELAKRQPKDRPYSEYLKGVHLNILINLRGAIYPLSPEDDMRIRQGQPPLDPFVKPYYNEIMARVPTEGEYKKLAGTLANDPDSAPVAEPEFEARLDPPEPEDEEHA